MQPGPHDTTFGVHEAALDRLHAYAALLATWSARINLVSRGDIPHIWARHVQDSLRLLPLIPPCVGRAIDIGSGAGLPGLVLAIATGIPFDLVEADRRKCVFLQEAARLTAAPVTVHHCRIEACGLAPAPLVTARALAPLPQLMALAGPLLAPGGVMLFPKGPGAPAELAASGSPQRFAAAWAGTAHSPILVLTDRNPAMAAAAHV